MQAITEILQQRETLTAKQPEHSLTVLKRITSLPPEENKIIQLKYAGTQIGLLDRHSLVLAANTILVKIHVITGWKFPSEPEFQQVLKDQFQQKLTESYPNCNMEEIEFAFRSNTTVKDWGKNMNLALIDEVMIPYLDKRYEVSTLEEMKTKYPEQKVYSEHEILNERRGHIETAYQAMRSGRIPIIHDYFAEVLLSDGILKDMKDLHQFFVNSLGNQVENIYVK